MSKLLDRRTSSLDIAATQSQQVAFKSGMEAILLDSRGRSGARWPGRHCRNSSGPRAGARPGRPCATPSRSGGRALRPGDGPVCYLVTKPRRRAQAGPAAHADSTPLPSCATRCARSSSGDPCRWRRAGRGGIAGRISLRSRYRCPGQVEVEQHDGRCARPVGVVVGDLLLQCLGAVGVATTTSSVMLLRSRARMVSSTSSGLSSTSRIVSSWFTWLRG